jgi:hypothetical protein
MIMMPPGREVPELPERLRLLWLVTKNYTERQKAAHQLSLHHFLRELKVANPLALQDSPSSQCSILTTILQVI